jgi:hypothetical protein
MFQLSDIFWCIIPSRLTPLPLLVLRLFELLPSFMLDSPHLFSFYPVRSLFYHRQMQSASISARLRTVISAPPPSFTQGSTCGRFSPVEEERPKSIQLQLDGTSIQWTTFFHTWTSALFDKQGLSALLQKFTAILIMNTPPQLRPPSTGSAQLGDYIGQGVLRASRPSRPASSFPIPLFHSWSPAVPSGRGRNRKQLSFASQEQNQPPLKNLAKLHLVSEEQKTYDIINNCNCIKQWPGMPLKEILRGSERNNVFTVSQANTN